MIEVIDALARRAAANATIIPEDYIENDLLHCGACHTPKQCYVTLPMRKKQIKVFCLCRCATEKRDQEYVAALEKKEFDRLKQMRDVAMTDRKLKSATFESSDNRNPEIMAKLKRYAERFDRAKQENIGLCLVGGVGTGKSYAAACVANRLLGKGTAVLMTNFSRVLNALSSGFDTDRNAYIRDLVKFPLLILDDFGIERNTQYSQEMVYNVIDARYRENLPLIVTTNISWSEMKNPADMTHQRIFDRIVEMCTPINFGTNGRRAEIAAAKREKAAELLLAGKVEG